MKVIQYYVNVTSLTQYSALLVFSQAHFVATSSEGTHTSVHYIRNDEVAQGHTIGRLKM